MPGYPVDVGTISRAPTVPSLDGTHLTWLLDQYITACYARLDRRHTVVGYEIRLRYFTRWWGEVGPSCGWLLHSHDLETFEHWLREVRSSHSGERLAYNTRNDVFRRLSTALRWAYDHGYVNRDYTSWLPKADGAAPKRKAIGVPALERLLHAGAGSTHPHRDQAMLAMMMGMGLRRAEVRCLEVRCLVFSEDGSGYANVVGKKTAANPSGANCRSSGRATEAIAVQPGAVA